MAHEVCATARKPVKDCCNPGEAQMRASFKTGFVAGYIAALGTCFAALVRLAYQPPSKWWPKR